jgi:hypothetical protein
MCLLGQVQLTEPAIFEYNQLCTLMLLHLRVAVDVLHMSCLVCLHCATLGLVNPFEQLKSRFVTLLMRTGETSKACTLLAFSLNLLQENTVVSHNSLHKMLHN